MNPSNTPKRIGFLGVGSIAREHAEVAQALGHHVAVGCATTIDSPRWKEFLAIAPAARFEPNGQVLLEDPSLDVIIACLPWNLNEVWLPRILATQKPVLLEKPVALSSQALKGALASPNVNPGNKAVGLNRRFYQTVQTLKERVDQGGVKSVEITVSETIESLSASYGPEIIEHILVYNSCHILDTAVYLLGELQPVRIYGHRESGYLRPFRSMSGVLETEHGVPVYLSIMADNPAPIGIRIYFEDRTTWHLSPLERLTAFKGYKRLEPSPGSKIRRYIPEPFLEVAEDAVYKPGFLNQMKAFSNGERQDISATLSQSLDLLLLIESLEAMADEAEAGGTPVGATMGVSRSGAAGTLTSPGVQMHGR